MPLDGATLEEQTQNFNAKVRLQHDARAYLQLDAWGMNVFKVNELAYGHALTVVTYTIMRDRDLFKRFDIPPSVLVNYLLTLEHHYKDNPYHNQAGFLFNKTRLQTFKFCTLSGPRRRRHTIDQVSKPVNMPSLPLAATEL